MHLALIVGRSQTTDLFFEVIHPATWEGGGGVADGGTPETRLAAAAVNVTQWQRTPAYRRTDLLLIRCHRLLVGDLAPRFLRVGIQP